MVTAPTSPKKPAALGTHRTYGHAKRLWPIIAPLALLTGVTLLAGCDRSTSYKPSATALAAAPTTQTRPATSQTSRPVPKVAIRDYVAQPLVDPAEKDAGPKRIISMAPSLTELCCALGLGDRMVGRTQYCIYPPAAQKVEIVGALLDPNIERILLLEPDLVLITRNSQVLHEKFAGLKLPVQVLPADSLDDICTAITQLGEAVHRPRTAAELVKNLRADLSNLRQYASHVRAGRSYKVLFVTGELTSPPHGVWVAGPGSYLAMLLEIAGAKTVVEGDRAWLEISPEQVLWLRPDVIVESREASQAPLRDEAVAAWRKLPGLASVRVVTLPDIAQLFPGPRVNVMLAKLIDGLYVIGDKDTASAEATTSNKGANAD